MDASIEDEGWLKVMEGATLCCVPMALKAAIELNVVDIIAKHAGGGGGEQYLTPCQIASHFESPLTASLEHASAALDRILRVLASHGFLSSSLHTTPEGLSTRAYGLTSISLFLLQNEAQSSLAPMVLLQQDPLVIHPFFHLHETVLDGVPPFVKAHGMPCWSYYQRDPRFDKLFNQAMANLSNSLMLSLLARYNGFEDITSLVDVGGGTGTCLHMITSKHPHIKAINFDQPHVIANAPPYPGVEHVGGDMFEEIPQASAIFMKAVLHDWSDDHCSKILENCYRALPKKGKVIVVDAILPVQVECELNARVRYHVDLLMLAYTQGGKERTQSELDILSKASGFSRLQVICNINGSSVVEIYKEPIEISKEMA